jgi:hypothetical protein
MLRSKMARLPAVNGLMVPKECLMPMRALVRISGGRGGIRTLEAVLPPTRFPVARTRPGYATLPSVVCGGEGGIRTHGGSSPHRFSRAAPSTTRTPLQLEKYTNEVSPDGARLTCGQQNRPADTGRRVRGTPGRIRTCGLWVRNPTLYPLSYRRASRILHQSDCDPPWRVIWGGKGGIRTLGALFQRSTA